MIYTVSQIQKIHNQLNVPGDKSVSHRALMLSSIALGPSHICNLSFGKDVLSTIKCLKSLGIDISYPKNCSNTLTNCVEIVGKGLTGLSRPAKPLNAGNSGTTLRLLSGILSGQNFSSIIFGDKSLNNRPMKRIIDPLTLMGAKISGRDNNQFAPLEIEGTSLNPPDTMELKVASAQVKSSIILASLISQKKTIIIDPFTTRNHTELMLKYMGVDISQNNSRITIIPSQPKPNNIIVPGDISSATYWIIAACCHPNATIKINNVGINPTRSAILDILKSMGANINISNIKNISGETIADISANSSNLKAIQINHQIIPNIIDELPILCLAACFAKGTTEITGAEELRVKESDRIKSTISGLKQLGVQNIEERPDGMLIHGETTLKGGFCRSYNDHRIAMTMAIGGILAKGTTTISGGNIASVSYPEFWNQIKSLKK